MLTPQAASESPDAKPKRRKTSNNTIEAGGYVLHLDKELGRGAFGRVVEGYAKGKPDQPRAIKMAQIRPESATTTSREADVLRKLSHINVVRLLDTFGYSSNVGEKYTVLVMELAASTLGESLPLSCGYRRFECGLQLCTAVLWLHQQKVMHRDIKPSNILLFRHDVVETGLGPFFVWKLGDFGLGKELGTGAQGAAATHTVCGTPTYVAPEVRRGEKYSEGADVYSLGVVLCEVVASVGQKERFGSAKCQELLRGNTALTSLLADRDLGDFLVEVWVWDAECGDTMKSFDNRSRDDLLSSFLWRSHPTVVLSVLRSAPIFGSGYLGGRFWMLSGVSGLLNGRQDLCSMLLGDSVILEAIRTYCTTGNRSFPCVYNDYSEPLAASQNEFFKFLLANKQVVLAAKFLGDEIVKFLPGVGRPKPDRDWSDALCTYVKKFIMDFGSLTFSVVREKVLEKATTEGGRKSLCEEMEKYADILGFPKEL